LKILTFKYEDSKVEMIQDDSAVQAVQDSPGNTPRLEGTEHQLH
jgi:carbonic anhydrase